MDIKKQVGKRIALAMELNDWSREEFAARLDVSRTYVSKLVRGEQNIGIETLQRIAAVLGQPISFFVEENYTLNLGQEVEVKNSQARRRRAA